MKVENFEKCNEWLKKRSHVKRKLDRVVYEGEGNLVSTLNISISG